MNVRLPYLFLALVLLGCQPKETAHQPSPIFFKPKPSADELTFYDLSEIQDAGVLIGGIITGPDTYYEYRGQAFGTQYLLAEEFAHEIGCRLQVEIASDTAILVEKLKRGEIDFIAMDVPRWQTRDDAPLLREAIRQWWKPIRMQQVEDAVQGRTRQAHRRARPVMMDAEHGVISQWDELFVQHSKTVGWDWRLLASLCYQESNFDPKAVSWAGAKGLMQLMPATAASLGVDESMVFDPQTNIAAGARYLKRVQNLFADIPDRTDRICFTLAAYNGGHSHIRDAMALAEKYGHSPHHWPDVAPFVLKLSEPKFYNDPVVKSAYMRGSETHNYVESIMDRWQQYRGIARATYSGAPLPAQGSMKDGIFQSAVKSAEEWTNQAAATDTID